MLFLRHPAWLWIKKHDPKKIPPVDDNTQAMFDNGHKFEPYAESLFPEGVSFGFNKYIADLLKYCKLDALAMVEVYRILIRS